MRGAIFRWKSKKVINQKRSEIRGIERNISKIERRIESEIERLERSIRHLLIDGNNASYEAQTFIGLAAIKALIGELEGKIKITVVFDASIRAMLRSNTRGIERSLGKSAKTYVAPTKSSADEYLLKIAEGESSTFILSNDRFAEYKEYDAVSSGRVLRFLVADGKLIANDLGLMVKFN